MGVAGGEGIAAATLGRISASCRTAGWMAGDRTVKRILPLLMLLLVASCSPSNKGSASSAPEDEKYDQALEYYTLTHAPGADPNRPADGPRGRPTSEIDVRTARRLLTLQEAIRAWRHEKPDRRVAVKDHKEVERLLERVFDDPISRSRMVVKTYDLKLCEGITYQFYNKNRGFVCVLFYDRGPRLQAGLDLYLFKHDGTWEIVYRTDWIG